MADTYALASSHSITPGDATTLATWVTALDSAALVPVTATGDFITVGPQANTIILTPLCTANNADLTADLWGYFGDSWEAVAKMDWSSYSTENPAGTSEYTLPSLRVTIPHRGMNDVRAFAIGLTAGTGGVAAWSLICQQDS